jgi:glycosyltransferase involved in cell wall biosynthesis
MKILHILTSLDGSFGGPSQAAPSLASAQAELGDEVVVLATLPRRAAPPSWPGVTLSVHKERRLPMSGAWGIFSLSLLLSFWRTARSYDVIHVHQDRGLVCLPASYIALARRRPLVIQTHGMCTPWRGWKRLIDFCFLVPLLRAAVLCFGLQADEASSLSSRTDTPVEILGNPLNVAYLEVPPTRVPRHPPLVIWVARLHRRKGLDVFLDMATLLLQKEETGYQFVIAGADDGELRYLQRRISANRKLAARCSYVGVLGVYELRSLYRDASVLVHPAEFEPFGMSILEAMSQGLPCVIAESSHLTAELVSRGSVFAVAGPAESFAETVVIAVAADSKAAQRARSAALAITGRSELAQKCRSAYISVGLGAESSIA